MSSQNKNVTFFYSIKVKAKAVITLERIVFFANVYLTIRTFMICCYIELRQND